VIDRRQAPDPGARRIAVSTVALGFFSLVLCAGEAAPGSQRRLTLTAALALAESKGFDALAAEAAVAGAAGDADAAGRLPNPAFSGSYLHSTSVPVPGGETNSAGFALTAGDQGAVEGLASGKRALRRRQALDALEAARANRDQALRVVRRETVRAYADVLLAEAALGVRRDVAGSFVRTLDLVETRLEYGAASRADRARVATARLEADQGVTAAVADVARSRATLGVWLGGEDLEGVVLDGGLAPALPAWLEGAGLGAARAELASRPDVRQARAELERAKTTLDLARRARLPDVVLSAGYARQGPAVAPVTPPTLSVGAAFELPVFSQQQGEIARAESDRVSARVALARVEAQSEAEVRASWAAFTAARALSARMEGELLARAREARDLVRYQYEEGAVSLLDLLDAERTALAVELERAGDLYALRVAVADLETAAGREVTP
jgi:outer membrane protein, heavy metal efflux system